LKHFFLRVLCVSAVNSGLGISFRASLIIADTIPPVTLNDVPSTPHVVIVGAGFAGLYAAKSLGRAAVRVTVIDRCNHHVFQPLLYEVATAALSPADIAAPIRTILARQKNATVLLARAMSVDVARRVVVLSDGEIGYDILILATGVTHSYFGHDDWAAEAPGLKTIDEATEIRRRFLLAFETAERETDFEARRTALTFVIVGGGPTGVELAGTMSELARRGIPRDFRSIDTTTARVILVEGGDRLLGGFPPELSEKARLSLVKLGVEVRLGHRVTHIDAAGVKIGDEHIAARNVFWAAGVQASAVSRSLGVPLDRSGRVEVEPALSIPSHPEVFVIGDLARAINARTGKEVPGVAPAAMQMGRHVARIIQQEAASGRTRSAVDRPAFRYVDKGILATIGRAKAVGSIKGIHVSGLIAWLLWAVIHITYLIGFRNRLLVILQWTWAYVVFRRGARLITGPVDLELTRTRDDARTVGTESPIKSASSPEHVGG